jgi:hypothetical protein
MQKTTVYLFGGQNEFERSKLFLPVEVMADSLTFVPEITGDVIKDLKNSKSTSRVAIIRAGFGFNVGFWEWLCFRKLSPGQVISIPKRTAIENPVNNCFQKFTPSPYEENLPANVIDTVESDFILSHGITLHEILKDGLPAARINIQKNGFEVIFDTSQALFEVDKAIVEHMRNVQKSFFAVEEVVNDIREIIKGTYIEQTPQAQIVQENNIDVQEKSRTKEVQRNRPVNPDAIVESKIQKALRDKKLNEFKQKRAKSKIVEFEDIPEDIRHRLGFRED